MRRTIPAALALTMLLGATAVATDEEPAPDEGATQRAEVPQYGLALELPADWRVSNPEGERISALTNAAGEEIMETTVLYANGGGGTWCDVDAYLSMDAPLEGHAYAYVQYLAQNESADSAMVVAEAELPAGPAYRIEIFEPANGRIRAMYLFDGPTGDDGTFERYLLTCASREADVPFWEAIAESAEFFEPVPDDAAAESEPAEPEPEATAEATDEG